MKKYTWLLVAAMVFMLMTPLYAAPLFGDVPDEHWARDAVANLAAKGLVEGYPDGTFKGDRAATRYELAMVVARFLAKNDQEHATFATKADLEELRKLVMQLKDELDALGVRVTNLEENVSKLDKRVTELERITFYGEIDSILVTQGFQNWGSSRAEYHVGTNAFGPTLGFNTVTGTVTAPAATTYYQQWNQSVNSGLYASTAPNYMPLYSYIPANPTVAPAFTSYNNGVQFNGANHTYNQLVGNVGGANISPYWYGNFPVADYRNGRPLTSGTGFSMKATLGINAKINDEIDAGLELAAYTSMGDPVVDAFYGVSAPYLCNPFTAQILNQGSSWTGQGSSNQPWTRMVLDNFWVKHKTSGIKLIGGSFGELSMDNILYAGVPNPNVNGPQYLNNYGFRVFGSCHFLADMDWEVFATRLADADPYRGAGLLNSTAIFPALIGQNLTQYGSDYNNWAYGVDFGWRFGGGNFKLGFLRATNDMVSNFGSGFLGSAAGIATTGAGPYGTNGIYTYTGANGLINPTGFNGQTNPFGWVNPSGWYSVQLAGGNPGGTAPSVVSDPGWINKSPIFTYGAGTNVNTPHLNGNDGAMGGYGPQETTNWNAKFSYKWDPSQLRFFIEYAASTWRPNMSSSFSRTGGAGRAGLGATLAQGKLDLDLTYKSAQAWYDPFTLRYPVGVNSMWRFPNMSYFPNMYQLHDSDTYPNNRMGWKFKVTYRFPDEKGKMWAWYEGLQQVNTSVYDVRYYTGAISGVAAVNLVPNSLVMGYTPGFIDPVFTPYAMGTYYNWNSAAPAAVANWGAPIEDPRGFQNNWGLGVDYKFPESGLIVEANYYDTNFRRSTGLVVNGLYNLGSGAYNVGAAPSANNVNLSLRGFHLGLQYPFNERFTGRIGYDWTNFIGHYDPNNIYWLYAIATGSSGFTNVDTVQSIPYLGFDYKINKNTEWGLNIQFFNTTDRIGAGLQPTTNVTTAVGSSYSNWRNTNPFSWNGVQIMTEFKVKF
ncbi:MAG: S-layer homology domain-containing protein [Candidatus Eremiobacteraeota bacterium]|nr:S-layer homology domain-containing protein [Candidatus Eremiobacteraeota bacterium]